MGTLLTEKFSRMFVYLQCMMWDVDVGGWDDASCNISEAMTHTDGFEYFVCSCSKYGTVR